MVTLQLGLFHSYSPISYIGLSCCKIPPNPPQGTCAKPSPSHPPLKPALHLHFLSYDGQHSSFNHLSKTPGSHPPSHLWALNGHQDLSALLLKSALKPGHLPMARFLVQASSFLTQNPVLHSNIFPPNPHPPGINFCLKKKKIWIWSSLLLLRLLQGLPEISCYSVKHPLWPASWLFLKPHAPAILGPLCLCTFPSSFTDWVLLVYHYCIHQDFFPCDKDPTQSSLR